MTLRSWIILIAGLALLEALLLAGLRIVPTGSGVTAIMAAAMVAALAGAVVITAGLAGRRWAFSVCVAVIAFVISASFRFGAGGELEADWQTVLKVAIYASAALMSAVMLRDAAPLVRGPTALATAFAAVAVLSSAYSPAPLFTLYAGATLLALVVTAGAAAQYLPERDMVVALVAGTGAHVVVALVLLATTPELVVEHWTIRGAGTLRLLGLTAHANTLGWLASLYVLGLVVMHRSHEWPLRLAAVLAVPGLLVLFLTWSRTAWIALPLTLLALSVRRHVVLLIALAIVGALVALFTSALDTGLSLSSLAARIARTGDAAEIFTVTGRTTIWLEAASAFTENPVAGIGYGATRFGMAHGIGHAHNLVLEALVGTGIIGAALLLCVLGWQTVNLYRRPHMFRDAVLIYVLVVGITEPSIVGPVPNVLTFVWLLSLYCSSKCAAESAASARTDA